MSYLFFLAGRFGGWRISARAMIWSSAIRESLVFIQLLCKILEAKPCSNKFPTSPLSLSSRFWHPPKGSILSTLQYIHTCTPPFLRFLRIYQMRSTKSPVNHFQYFSDHQIFPMPAGNRILLLHPPYASQNLQSHSKFGLLWAKFFLQKGGLSSTQ